MINNWKLITEEKAMGIWNEELARFDDCSPFQTFEWGQYHKALGWKPLYFACFDGEEKITSLALVLLKRYFLKTGFAWIPGGPVGNLEDWNDSLPQAVIADAGLRRLYLRVRSDRRRSTREALFLEHEKWLPSLDRMVSSFSMELELSDEIDEIDRNFRRSWRRQLKRSGRNNLVVKQIISPDAAELRQAFREMEDIKGLPELFSEEKLERLFHYVHPNLILFRCEDAAGNLLSFRAVLRIGHRAVEYLGVTNERGRKLRASFPLERELVRYCQERGIRKYDLGGIDPFKNPGCHRFKRGTGATEVEYLGEWDWATSTSLRLFGNWAIRKRMKIRWSGTAVKSDKKSALGSYFYGSVVRMLRGIAVLRLIMVYPFLMLDIFLP